MASTRISSEYSVRKAAMRVLATWQAASWARMSPITMSGMRMLLRRISWRVWLGTPAS